MKMKLFYFFAASDFWRLGSEGGEVPQQSRPPPGPTWALHRLLLLHGSRTQQPVLSERGHDLLSHSQSWQWLHSCCEKNAQPNAWVSQHILVAWGSQKLFLHFSQIMFLFFYYWLSLLLSCRPSCLFLFWHVCLSWSFVLRRALIKARSDMKRLTERDAPVFQLLGKHGVTTVSSNITITAWI